MSRAISHPLWDLPTRIFHWSIVCLLPLAWWSAESQNYDLHRYVGCSVIVLVLTRIIWGFAGSLHSRFSDFVVGPKKLLEYLQKGASPSDSAGHNPLGGWSVLVLLSLLLLQAVSGLFNSDDILYSGPLYYSAPDAVRSAMGEIHDWAFNLLLGFVALHVLAVLYHQLGKKQPLIRAMVFGQAAHKAGRSKPVAWWWALLVVLVLGLMLLWGLDQAPQPEPSRWY
jgi:cytochrome b